MVPASCTSRESPMTEVTEVRLFSAIRHVIFLVGSSLFIAAAAASAIPLKLLGVAPLDVTYYNSGPIIWCKDRSKSFSVDRLNDDFCDCPDATDEPGTSACPNGKFFCKNQKQLPFWVFSSRVNDGICDCCDGSDEYDGRVQCKSACHVEAGDVLIQSESLKDTTLKTSWKNRVKFFSSEEDPNSASKPKYLKMLIVLEIVLVVMALRQFYTWTCRRGSRLRMGLPR